MLSIRLGIHMVGTNQESDRQEVAFSKQNHMATVYCHGSQMLENLNVHIDLCYFWIITYKWSKELTAQNYIFTSFGGLFVTMYTTNHGPIKFLIKVQEKKYKHQFYLNIQVFIYKTTKNIQITHNCYKLNFYLFNKLYTV